MKLVKKISTLSAIACAMLVSQSAMAYDEFSDPDWANSAWYIGAGAGKSKATIDQDRIVKSLMNSGSTSVNFNANDSDTGYKFFVGKQLNKYFALEAGYFDLGKFGFNATTTPAGSLNGEVAFKGFSFDALAQLPITDRFSAYGILGLNYAKSTAHFTGNRLFASTNPNPSENKLNPKLALGLEYKLTQALAVRGEVARYRVNDAVGNRGDVDLFSINVVYKLGQPERTSPAYVAPEKPVAVAEPVVMTPAPAPAPAPAPVATSEKVSFAADALFDFDKSDIKPNGQKNLDDMLAKLQGMNTEVIVAVGHTDSVGSDDYNQKLSLRRAEAVKAYLVSKGLEASRVYIEGKGETQPVADNGTAEGRSQNRRVTVEVVGTRSVTK